MILAQGFDFKLDTLLLLFVFIPRDNKFGTTWTWFLICQQKQVNLNVNIDLIIAVSILCLLGHKIELIK